MTFYRHLPDDDIDEIHAATIQLNLAGSRDALISGLPNAFQMLLEGASNLNDQIRLDLRRLNTTEVIWEGDQPIVPLKLWLTAAYQSRKMYPEARVFLDKLSRIKPLSERALLAIPMPPGGEPKIAFRDPPRHEPPPQQAPAKPEPAKDPYPATAVMITIKGLTTMAGPDGVDALTVLHRTLRGLGPALAGCRVLSSVTGAILVIRDNTLPKALHDPSLLPAWLTAIDAAGLSVRAGVAHSQVEDVVDADDTINVVGRSINIAARLATSEDNPGLLYEKSYVDRAAEVVRSKHFLHPSNHRYLTVMGKRDERFTCVADPTVKARAANDVPELPDTTAEGVVLLAYDLPGFSDGYLRTLASRFRDVSREVRKLRERSRIPTGAKVAFSPGGDGGVLSINGIAPHDALQIALELAGKLTDASETRSKDASTWARIGVHYGQTYVYPNAEGIQRPTGHALFAADALTGDKAARRWDSIVVSGALIEQEGARWKKIEDYRSPLGHTIHRFVDRNAPELEEPKGPAAPRAPAPNNTPPAQTAPPTRTPKPTAPELPFTMDELFEALLHAFPSYSELQIMLAHELDKRLNEIAPQDDLRTVVFAVLSKAESGGWLQDLFDAAYKLQPDNPKLKALKAKQSKA